MQTVKFALIRSAVYTCTYRRNDISSSVIRSNPRVFPTGGNRGTFKLGEIEAAAGDLGRISFSPDDDGDSRRNDTRNPSGDNEINFRGIRNRATIRSLEMPFRWLVRDPNGDIAGYHQRGPTTGIKGDGRKTSGC